MNETLAPRTWCWILRVHRKKGSTETKKMNPKWNQVGGEKLVGYVVCVSCKTNPAVVELKSQTSGKWWRTRLADDVDPSTDSMAIDWKASSKTTESKLRQATKDTVNRYLVGLFLLFLPEGFGRPLETDKKKQAQCNSMNDGSMSRYGRRSKKNRGDRFVKKI